MGCCSEQYVPMQQVIPPSTNGNARIEHYTITEEEANFAQMRAAITARRDEYVESGDYVLLKINGATVMSDTIMERNSNLGFLWHVNGDVLVAGLGIGLILVPALRNKEIRSVTVIEKSRDVIQLVEPPLRKYLNKHGIPESLLRIVEADIFKWKPPKGKKWDVIYFDIWADICTDNLEEISKLKRKFARRLNRSNPKCRMSAWKENDLRYFRRRDRRWGV